MIKKLEIKKLFGRFNYNILFRDDKLSILTGPNGFGKSTILKIIEAFNKLNIDYFFDIDFEEIDIVLSSEGTGIDETFNIYKYDEMIKINGVSFNKKNSIGSDDKRLMRNYLVYKYKNHTKKEFAELMEFMDDDIYMFNNYDEILDSSEEYDSFIKMYGNSKGKNKKKRDLLLKMKELGKDTHFIREQRLLKMDENNKKRRSINVIEEISIKFKRIMNKLSQEYFEKSNKLDSTYPARLFETKEGITKEEYQTEIREMQKKLNKLKEYNISDISELPNFTFNKEHSKALKIYLQDFSEKYKVCEDYIWMFDLYCEILNERLAFKKVRISKEEGLSVYDVDNEDRKINLTQLSSGEKQEVLLFFDLIFDTKENTLLLIDEPEISLHISWQRTFIDDLLKIIYRKKFRVIIATHSPQIISNHWDMQIDLGELYGQ